MSIPIHGNKTRDMKRHNSILTAIAIFTLTGLSATYSNGVADDHHHHEHHSHDAKPNVPPPIIFLDKSERIVWYQLDRLDNERLLAVETKTDDVKYAPVFTAILIREGMSPQYREEALKALSTINNSDVITEILAAMERLDSTENQQKRTAKELAVLLLSQPVEIIEKRTSDLEKLLAEEDSVIRPVAYAALISAGKTDVAWKSASQSDTRTIDWLQGVSLVTSESAKADLRSRVVELTGENQKNNVRIEAIKALAGIRTDQQKTFRHLAPMVKTDAIRSAVVQTLSKVPAKQRDQSLAPELVQFFIELAMKTPAAERTNASFLEAMQLADQLLGLLPIEQAKESRAKLREYSVRVVVIHTVEEEMRYDIPYFAVEAGRPVQILLKNEDLMPHNLVVTLPDALQEVAELGTKLGPNPGFENKPYVPKSEKVLFATGMVQARQQERLTFTAPEKPGEYPYVCTFPRHWMRMYGVMVVVPNLDEWLQNPTKPKDPVGSNRSFVQSWKVKDFEGELEKGLQGRTQLIGKKLFAEATCAQCHKLGDTGGAVGPALDDVFKHWKGDRVAVLREILDPSHRIDPKYAVNVVILESGKVLTGIIVAEDKTTVSLLANPEAKEPAVVQKSEILEREKTSTSMMPKALLDRFSKEEIFEILSYIEASQKK